MSELNMEYSSSRFVTLDGAAKLSAKIKVVGVGGGGGNAVDYMIKRGIEGVEYFVINTDAQVLESNLAAHKIQIGKNLTKGLGAGADPTIGKKAIEEDRDRLSKLMEDADMVFVTAGMGGGTGTGAAPIVASIAKSVGALVIAIVTKPFSWEGKSRMRNAESGIDELRQYVDSLIVIPNERILNIMEDNTSVMDAFDKPNEILYEATKGISEIITLRGKVNVDFADVRMVMNQSGFALMGCGVASGPNRCIEAATKAISSPLLEGVDIKGAKKILLNITASSAISIKEVNAANMEIMNKAGEDADLIFGIVQKEEMNESVSYTVIATGFDSGKSLPIDVENNNKNGKMKAAERQTVIFDSNIDKFRRKIEFNSKEESEPIRGFSYKDNQDEEPFAKTESYNSNSAKSSSFLKMMMD